MTNENIVATFKHEYTTEFIIDDNQDFSKLCQLNLEKYDRLFFIYDENVEKLYGNKIKEKLRLLNKEIFSFSVEAVEYSKSINFYPKLVAFLEQNNAGRYDAVIAVGGGIIIDLVSFSVSTYMRGLPFFIIATTLIGQTDASTAGKTCLNTSEAKNLLGTFYYPKAVYNNIPMLKTNSQRILRQGLSECFKYGLLTSESLVDKVVKCQGGSPDLNLLTEIVKDTINARIHIRQIDPLASNLGHTFGHALEKYYNYEILHGDAITIGTVLAIYFSKYCNLMKPEVCEKIFNKLKEAKLNIYISKDLDVKKLIGFMKKDKKSSSLLLHLVLIKDIAVPYNDKTPFYEVPYEVVEKFLNEFLETYDYKIDNYCEFLAKEKLLDS